jgi:DNA-binding NarL/FixJ family response regulator
VEAGNVAIYRAVQLPTLRVGVLAVGGFDPATVVEALDAAGLDPVREVTAAGRVDALVVAAETASEAAAGVERILAEEAPVPVVGVARRLRPNDVRAALRIGLSGIVEHDRVPAALGLAVRAACAGLVAVPSRVRTAAAGPVLSTREKQILALVVLGFTNGEIARKLYVAESTVKSHLSSAFAKLGVRSRNEATALILDEHNGLGTGILAITDARDAVPVGAR